MKRAETTQALFYKPTDRWQIWISFGATILLYLTALALAAHEPEGAPFVSPPDVDVDVIPTPDTAPPPPPVVEDIPEAVQPPDLQSDFPEENPTPAPRKHVAHRDLRPLVRRPPAGVAGTSSLSSAKVLAISAPRPEYPYEARRQRLTGSGVAVLIVDAGSGVVTDVTISRSTGSAILDNAAISGFRRWRFKPGTVAKVQAPITFTLTGAAY